MPSSWPLCTATILRISYPGVNDLAKRRRIVISVATLAALGLIWSRRRQSRRASGLTAAQERFLKRATLLEAQQVPFYHLLALRAHRLGLLHIEAGYLRAMDVEADHLRDLKAAGRGLGVKLGLWEQLGDRIGRLSGGVISAFDPRVGLRVICRVERVAAKEYANARAQVSDVALQQLYMGNQVDEEGHQAWASLMLREFDQGQSE